MQKKFGAPLLIAGTCIGSGMIALPLVLSKIGLVLSIAVMVVIWVLMYYTSLINLELNLQAGKGMSLGELGRRFSGRTSEFIGILCLKLLSYALLAAFIYGGSSIIQELLDTKYSIQAIGSLFAGLSAILLLFPVRIIDYFNRCLFLGLLAVVALLLSGLLASIEWRDLPLFSEHSYELSSWTLLIPVVFTSFGFQVIFHTLTNYCDQNPKLLKNAFFYGSLIPAIVYILWTSSILSVVYHDNPAFYAQMAAGNVEVGELIEVLSEIAKSGYIELLVWWISLLAIATSVLGVGVGLVESISEMLKGKVASEKKRTLASVIITILPAYLAVVFIPNAFISVLGFAGMILAIIAIILPIYLFLQIKETPLNYVELKRKIPLYLSITAAFIVIASELVNILMHYH